MTTAFSRLARRLAGSCTVMLMLSCGGDSPAVVPPAAVEMSRSDSVRLDVRRADPAALEQFEDAYEASARRPRAVFEKFLPVLGAATLLTFLEDRYPGCHAESHELGQALYAVSGDLEVSLSRCDTRCTSGCMHGVVTEALGEASVQSIQSKMESFCRQGEMASLHRPGNCAHGIGHALMFVNHGEVARSIEGCLGFAREGMQYYCATGVFMDDFLRDSTMGVTPSSLLSPCDQETLFPAACYRYKGAEMLATLGGTDAVANECARLADLQRRGCFHGLGYAAIGIIFQDPARLVALCAAGDRADRIVCIEGVIEKLADLNEGRARGACAFIEDDTRPVCDEAVRREMYGLDKPTFALYFDRDAIARRRGSVRSPAHQSVHGH
jgi:hypothetical protein